MNATAIGRPMEILLVEDNLEDARTTIEALTRKNLRCRITLVCDGEEAIDFLHREGIFARAPKPDLILLDLELPRKDGREVLYQVRSNPELRDIPVLVLTASRTQRAALEGENLFIEGYMTKPVNIEQFIGAVRKLHHSWMVEAIELVAV